MLLQEKQLNLFAGQGLCKWCLNLFDQKHTGKKNEKKFCKETCRIEYHKEETRKAKRLYRERKVS